VKNPYPLTLAIRTMARANSKVRLMFDSRSVCLHRAGRTADSNFYLVTPSVSRRQNPAPTIVRRDSNRS
jgi:hypothetical protein